MKQDEFRMRYVIKLSSSAAIVLLNMVIQMILPRAFSVEEYGYYTYNLNVFTSVVTMATLSVPNALVSKFSKRNEEIGLILFYIKFYAVLVLILNMAVIFFTAADGGSMIFEGQSFIIVLLGLETSIVLRLQTDSIGIFDAMAISRFPAVIQIVIKTVLAAVVAGGYFAGRLNLFLFYASQTVVVFSAVLYMLAAIIKEQKCRYPKIIDRGMKAYFWEYYEFCRPLVLSNAVSQIIVIFMNWVLLKWAGASGQAMFGAAWQLNTLVSYVFSPYAELSKREFAVMCKNAESMKICYLHSLRLMIWLVSYFAVFIGFLSEWILPVIYGEGYADAAQATLLIMFYTVYQAWGQISGSFLLGIEKTKVYAVLGIIGQLFTFGLVFVFQLPNFIWPEGLGSTGIALTYLVSNIVSIACSLYVNAKILNISFVGSFMIQFPPLLICSALAVILRILLDSLLNGNAVWIYVGKIFAAGVLYTFVLGSIVWFKPQLMGISKENLRAVAGKKE